MPRYYDRTTGLLLPQQEIKSRPGNYRDSNLADARKVNALVSTTTYIDVLGKPGLVKWMVEQGIRATMLPRFNVPAEETQAEAVEWYYLKSLEYTHAAQDFGTAIHYWVSKGLRAVETMEIPPMIPGAEEIAEELLEWFPRNGFLWAKTEHSFTRPDLGWAGTVDLIGFHHGVPCIGDIKSQVEPLTPYDPEHPLQLASYDMGCHVVKGNERWSFLVDRANPGNVKAHLWRGKGQTVEETNAHYNKMFLLLVDFWCMVHRYDPRVEIA